MSFGLIIILIADTQLFLEEALSVRLLVHWSVGLSIGPSVRNLFFWRAETKTAKDLCRVSGLVVLKFCDFTVYMDRILSSLAS